MPLAMLSPRLRCRRYYATIFDIFAAAALTPLSIR